LDLESLNKNLREKNVSILSNTSELKESLDQLMEEDIVQQPDKKNRFKARRI